MTGGSAWTMIRPCSLARTQQARTCCVLAGRPAFPPDTTRLWASRQPWQPRSRAGGDDLNPGVLFSEFPSSTPGYFCADFSHPRMRPPPSPFLRTFPDPPTRLNSRPGHDTPIVFPQITRTHPKHSTPAYPPWASPNTQNNPSPAITPNSQPSPRTTQKRPHTRFLRFALPLPHPPYSTPK